MKVIKSWFQSVIDTVTRSQQMIYAPAYIEGDKKSKKAMLTDPAWLMSPIFGIPRKIEYAELDQYENDITVAAAVDYIVDQVATSEWSIVGDDPTKEVNGDEATDFFKSSKWDVSFETLLRSFVTDILHYDSGTIVVEYPEFCYNDQKELIKTAKPVSMVARDGRSFLINCDMYGDLKGYYQYSFIHQGTKPIPFKPEEIIYVSERPQSRSPYGKSKLETVKNVTDLMMALQLSHRAGMENNLDIGGVIGHPNIQDPDRLKQLSQMYNTKTGGEGNSKRWLITGGEVDVNPVSASPHDSTWIEGARYYQESILSIFKVPRSVLGMTTDVNRATSETQTSNFKTNGVATMLTLIEEVLTREIVKKYFGKDLAFKFTQEIDLNDELIRADIDQKNIASGIVTANELRIRDGRDPIKEIPIEKSLKLLEDKATDATTDLNDEQRDLVEKEIERLYD